MSVGDVELDDVRAPDGEVLVGHPARGAATGRPGAPGPAFEVCVDVVEPLGDEVLVHGSVAAPDGAPATEPEEGILAAETETGRANVIVRLPPEDRPDAGSILRVAIAPNALRLFDPSTGRAIEPT